MVTLVATAGTWWICTGYENSSAISADKRAPEDYSFETTARPATGECTSINGDVAITGWNLRKQYTVAAKAASTSVRVTLVYNVETQPTGTKVPSSPRWSNTPP